MCRNKWYDKDIHFPETIYTINARSGKFSANIFGQNLHIDSKTYIEMEKPKKKMS